MPNYDMAHPSYTIIYILLEACACVMEDEIIIPPTDFYLFIYLLLIYGVNFIG